MLVLRASASVPLSERGQRHKANETEAQEQANKHVNHVFAFDLSLLGDLIRPYVGDEVVIASEVNPTHTSDLMLRRVGVKCVS
jgi:hypothetical protein